MPEQNSIYIEAGYKKLISNLVLPWRRKGTSILQIGYCGFFSPQLFVQNNFDTSVFYYKDAMRSLNSALQDDNPETQFGDFVDLPFQDGEFTYSLIFFDDIFYWYTMTTAIKNHENSFMENFLSVLSEAIRVTTKNIVIISSKKNYLFFPVLNNSKEISSLDWSKKDKILKEIIQTYSPKHTVTVNSILNLPPLFWGDSLFSSNILRKFTNFLCFTQLPFAFGLITAYSIDLKIIPLTPSGTLKTILSPLLPKRPDLHGITDCSKISSKMK